MHRYRVPQVARRHVCHIINFEDDVIVIIHVGEVLGGRHFLGHPSDITC